MPKFLEVTNKAAARAAIEAVSTSAGLQYVAGLDGSGVTDMRSALQAIIDAASAGDTIYLPPGKFLINAELVINKPLKIVGSGGRFTTDEIASPPYPQVPATAIVTSSATANGIKVTGKGVILEDFAIINTRAIGSGPTAGTGLLFEGSNQYALSRMTVQGFYDCVRTDGFYFTINECAIYDPVRYGMFFTQSNAALGDSGDCGVSNCIIVTQRESIAAVRWESGGGVRWVNNKINYYKSPGRWQYGMDISVADGVGTGEFQIIGGAIAWATTAHVRVAQKGPLNTGGFSYLTISGVVFQGIDSETGVAIQLGTGNVATQFNIRQIVVTGCIFHQFPAGGIVANAMTTLIVGPNAWGVSTYTQPIITITNLPQLDIARQTIVQTVSNGHLQNVTVIKDNRALGTGGALDGVIDYNYKRNVYVDTTVSGIGVDNWVTIFTVEPPDLGGAGFIDAVFSGRESGNVTITHFTKRISRSYFKNNATVGGAVTIATVGTDQSAGTTNHTGLQVVDGGAGKVEVQVAMLTGGTLVRGELEINVSGRVKQFSLGEGITPGS